MPWLFDEIDDSFVAASNSVFDLPVTGFTLIMRARPGTITAGSNPFMYAQSRTDFGNPNCYHIYVGETTKNWTFNLINDNSNGAQADGAAASAIENKWQTIFVTKVGTTYILYRDMTQLGTATPASDAVVSSTNALYFGRRHGATDTRWFGGQLAQFGKVNRILSTRERRNIVEGDSPDRYVLDGKPGGWFAPLSGAGKQFLYTSGGRVIPLTQASAPRPQNEGPWRERPKKTYGFIHLGSGGTDTPIEAEKGSYALSGQDANLLIGRRLDAEKGAYELTGQDVTFLQGFFLTAEKGEYTLSGQVADLLRSHNLIADKGEYLLTGVGTDLLHNRRLDAVKGAYELDGQDATLLKGYRTPVDTGSYTLSGQQVSLLQALILDAVKGSYTLSGKDATLTVSLEGALTALTGSYTLTGQTVNLLRGLLLTAEDASYTLTGQDVNLLLGFFMEAEKGAYSLTGQDVTLTHLRVLTAETGHYVLSGYPATLGVAGTAAVVLGLIRLIGIKDEEKTLTGSPD